MKPSICLLLMFTSCTFLGTLALEVDDFQLGMSDENGVTTTTGTEGMFTTDVSTLNSTPNFDPLSDSEKAEIVERHNDGRRSVYPEASNMNIVVWDDELDSAALASTDSCYYTITTSDFNPTSRQVVQFAGITQVDSFRISTSITSWFDLGNYYRHNTRTCIAPSIDYCNVYKLITWAKMTKIGCAQTYCPDLYDAKADINRTNIWYFKCNYEEVGRYNADIDAYLAGTQCTECSSGSGWCNTGLCDETCSSSNDSCSCEWDTTCNLQGSIDQETCRCTCNAGWSGDNCEIQTTVSFSTVIDTTMPTTEYTTDEDTTFVTADSTPVETTVSFSTEIETTMPTTENTTDEDTTFVTADSTHVETTVSFSTEIDTTMPTTENTTDEDTTFITADSIPVDRRLLNNPCLVDNGGCSHVCRVVGLSNRILCSCRRGYQLLPDGSSCAKLEGLCSTGNDCEHICTDEIDGYICSCNSSYILFYDEASCVFDVCGLGSYCNMNGLLDEDTCRCHCFSGYKGKLCNLTCSIDESSCWEVYESPVIRYDENVCPIFNPTIACDDEYICENDGYLEKQSGFEDVSGMCRCYCPFPWSGSTCEECNVECIDGTLDPSNCTCSCNDGYYGVDCSTLCKQTSLLCTRHTEGRCNHNVIRRHCPIMCGVCVQDLGPDSTTPPLS